MSLYAAFLFALIVGALGLILVVPLIIGAVRGIFPGLLSAGFILLVPGSLFVAFSLDNSSNGAMLSQTLTWMGANMPFTALFGVLLGAVGSLVAGQALKRKRESLF